MTNQQDKVGSSYWTNIWQNNEIGEPINPFNPSLRNYLKRKYHQYFIEAFQGLNTNKMTLLEVGCARSRWLPYFHQQFGCEVYGLDYSEVGCQQARNILTDLGVDGEIIQRDLFADPQDKSEFFDVVVSFGLVEHFEDTSQCILALTKYLKPQGIIITLIPNMIGLRGFLVKRLNRPFFDMHILLDLFNLEEAHQKVGLKILSAQYFVCAAPFIIDLPNVKEENIFSQFLKLGLKKFLMVITAIIWLIDENLLKLPTSKIFSPYIMCLAKKIS
jgi:2-polyprenyl-3-methyl-5-hydroxy-6-metoxy-1,4-benzoquinol methylase